MENKYHKSLTKEKWHSFSKDKQILNIAAEFFRAKNWLEKNSEMATDCFNRAFELLDLTLNDRKWGRGLHELWRFREVLAIFYSKKIKTIEELDGITKVFLLLNKDSAKVGI